jgi:hypothetical protein
MSNTAHQIIKLIIELQIFNNVRDCVCSYVETGFEAYLVPCQIRIGDILQIKRPERNAN